MANVKIKGLDQVVRNLNKEIARIKGATIQGLIRAQIHIRRSMDTVAPKIPVDTGNLRASYFSVASDGNIVAGADSGFMGDKAGDLATQHAAILNKYLAVAIGKKYPNLILGFSANYAATVHEMVGAHFRRRDSGAKFLEAAIKREKETILKIIADEAKIKP